MDVIVVAKQPRPGRVKTRMCPPCTPVEAAAVAEAALTDTLDAATRCGADRVVLSLDGRPGPWCPPGVTVVGQGGGGLDRRLTTAWTAVRGPALLVGMDTPQVGAAELDDAMGVLDSPGVDAVLGPAADGGWWAVGLRRPHPRAFVGVPMSRADTGAWQHARLLALGLHTRRLATHGDVDTWADALAVAAAAPGSRCAAAVRAVSAARGVAGRGATAGTGPAAATGAASWAWASAGTERATGTGAAGGTAS